MVKVKVAAMLVGGDPIRKPITCERRAVYPPVRLIEDEGTFEPRTVAFFSTLISFVREFNTAARNKKEYVTIR